MPDRPLSEIDAWIFDLDNTLYPASCRLFEQIQRRMTGFIVELLGVDEAEAQELRRRYFREHGTTLRGLMTYHGIEPRRFMDYVHEVDLSVVPRNLQLGAALAALPGRKLVFTNGSKRHAERLLAHLGIEDHFAGVFDIEAAAFMPKPDPAAYAEIVRRYEVVPERAAMIEDMAKNLKPAAALGMTTVWVRGEVEWAAEGSDADYIDHVVDDLAAFLLAAGAAGAAAAG
jgi:putative hydrolase of the HAD superfamily